MGESSRLCLRLGFQGILRDFSGDSAVPSDTLAESAVEQRDLTFVIPTYRLRDVGETVHEYDQHSFSLPSWSRYAFSFNA